MTRIRALKKELFNLRPKFLPTKTGIVTYLLSIAMVSGLLLAGQTVHAQELDETSIPLINRNSIPETQDIQIDVLEDAAESQRSIPLPSISSSAVVVVPKDPNFANKVTVGLNKELSRYLSINSYQKRTRNTYIPPDTMGAVGPSHIVQLINGNFRVFDKQKGKKLLNWTLDEFWTTKVGLAAPNGDTFDPRIVFDQRSQRWFAVSIDRFGSDSDGDGKADTNYIYLGRSDTSDPTYKWQGKRFPADTEPPAEFHDYPTLAVDADGVFICTDDFDKSPECESNYVPDCNVNSCYSIPKKDILQDKPSINRMTRFESIKPADAMWVYGSYQVALNFGPSENQAMLLASIYSDKNKRFELVRNDIKKAAGAMAELDSWQGITADPLHINPLDARQPPNTDGSTALIDNVAPRFVGNIVQRGGLVWAVHAVRGNAAPVRAIRWYKIDKNANQVFGTSFIQDTDFDLHEPSIAVNNFGDVVIGYTCSGPQLPASVCVSIGETPPNGVNTTFLRPHALKVGAGKYARYTGGPKNPINRWGDYSATVVDPQYQCAFWTFQEFVAEGAPGDVGPGNVGGKWGVQLTKLTINRCDKAICDIDEDKDVDSADVRLIAGMRGQNVPPANPLADFDGDGVISVNDARACVTKCTRKNCALE